MVSLADGKSAVLRYQTRCSLVLHHQDESRSFACPGPQVYRGIGLKYDKSEPVEKRYGNPRKGTGSDIYSEEVRATIFSYVTPSEPHPRPHIALSVLCVHTATTQSTRVHRR